MSIPFCGNEYEKYARSSPSYGEGGIITNQLKTLFVIKAFVRGV